MFAIVIRNYTRNKQTDFKAQSLTEALGVIMSEEKIISPAQTAQTFNRL